MNDLQTALEWLAVQLRALGLAIAAFWEAAVSHAAPALARARDWIAAHLQAAIDAVESLVRTESEAGLPYLAMALAAAAPHWPEIGAAGATAAAIGGIALWSLRSFRRKLKLKASLQDATLGYDPKTDWLDLAIVLRNLQPQPLFVRGIEIVEPPGTKICERWQAWRPAAAGVKFVAPELELTNRVPIGRTVLPFGAVNYVGFGAGSRHRRAREKVPLIPEEDGADPRDELIRRFYVLPPRSRSQQGTLRARLICELQTRRGHRQHLVFRRTLPLAAPPAQHHGNEAALLEDEHASRGGAPETVATPP